MGFGVGPVLLVSDKPERKIAYSTDTLLTLLLSRDCPIVKLIRRIAELANLIHKHKTFVVPDFGKQIAVFRVVWLDQDRQLFSPTCTYHLG